MIKSARFVTSSQHADQCPPPNRPEYAFIGRSNVGKSSLINMLCRSGKLAKTSSIPGKTQLINHFLVNDHWYLVDLPGYGYAKVAKTQRAVFSKMILNYLSKRENLVCLFILIDARIQPQALDLEFMRSMGQAGIPFALVFTKADKLTPTVLKNNLEHYGNELLKEWEELPLSFITSAEKGDGREDLLLYIEQLNKEWEG